MQKILFRIILILLFLPMLQAQFGFVKVGELEGYVEKPSDVTLDTAGWFSGSYQENKEKYIKRNFGFFNWAVRVENQLAFSLYGMSRSSDVIIGKKGYLYQLEYLNTRRGTDFMGKEVLVELAKKTKVVQDTLRAMGKSFFIVIAPDKADFYPEYIPDEYQRTSNDVLTNYGVLLQEFKDRGIHHLDLNGWFVAMKDTSTYPLYPKTGTHYSIYGTALTAQRIIAEVERQSGKDLPELYWDEVIWSKIPQKSDDDIENILNLVFRIPNIKLAYPQIKINEKGKYRPKAIAIGDSFYWEVINMGMSDKIFNEGLFWHHMNTVHPGELNMIEEMDKAEVVFIILTTHNLKKFLPKFIKNLHDPERIKVVMERIRNTPEWLAAVKQKAESTNVSLSTQIYRDAKYFVEEQEKAAGN